MRVIFDMIKNFVLPFFDDIEVTVHYNVFRGTDGHRVAGESRQTTPGDYDIIDIVSVIYDGKNIINEIDLDDLELLIIESLY